MSFTISHINDARYIFTSTCL